MSLLKLPLSRELVCYHGNKIVSSLHVLVSCHGQIATLLTDLGYSQAEVGNLFKCMKFHKPLTFFRLQRIHLKCQQKYTKSQVAGIDNCDMLVSENLDDIVYIRSGDVDSLVKKVCIC